MLYVEFISRDPGIPREIFRYIADQSTSWVGADKDLYLGQLARTMRIGPHPAYMTFFRVSGLSRLQEWEDYFLSNDYHLNYRSFAMQRSLQMVRDGCYDELVEAAKIREGLYYLEFFDAGGCDNADIEAFFANRTKEAGGQLSLLARRIGMLAPPPGGIAGVRVEDHQQLEKFVRAVPNQSSPIKIHEAGLYRSFGMETT